MWECRKNKSVLEAEDHDDFLAKLDLALNKRDDATYLAVLRQEALDNTWDAKAAQIADLIRQNLAVTNQQE